MLRRVMTTMAVRHAWHPGHRFDKPMTDSQTTCHVPQAAGSGRNGGGAVSARRLELSAGHIGFFHMSDHVLDHDVTDATEPQVG